MELKINICITDSCKVIVQDITTDYAPESSQPDPLNFKYKKSKSIVVVLRFTSENSKIIKEDIIEHTDNDIVISIPVNFDGWFKIYYLVIPTIEWINLFNLNLIYEEYSGIYYVNENNLIVKIINSTQVELPVDINELIEVNTESSTICKYVLDNVSICNLRKCYLDVVNKILNSNFISRCFNNTKDKDAILKRDLLSMAINSIKYLVEFCQFAEAQRLIERLTSCNGLCSNKLTSSLNHGCGCMQL